MCKLKTLTFYKTITDNKLRKDLNIFPKTFINHNKSCDDFLNYTSKKNRGLYIEGCVLSGEKKYIDDILSKCSRERVMAVELIKMFKKQKNMEMIDYLKIKYKIKDKEY